MAKEIDLTQYNNLRMLGLLKETGEEKQEIEIEQVNLLKQEIEIDNLSTKDIPIEISVNAIKQEIEPINITTNPKYRDIYDENTGNKIPFNEANDIIVSTTDAGSKVGSPDLSDMLEEHLKIIEEVKTDLINPGVTSITSPKNPIDITIDNDFEITYKKLYLEVSATLTEGLGKGEELSAEEITEKLNDLMYRKNNINSELDIFLYNVFPYIGTNIVNTILNSKINTSNPISVFRLGSGIKRILSVIKYFTVFELIFYLGSNFYTLHFLRGISIKKGFGFFGPTELDNNPDLLFGRAKGWFNVILDNIDEFVENLLFPRRVIGVGNSKLTEFKDGIFAVSPYINLDRNNQIVITKKQSLSDDLSRPDPLDITNSAKFFSDPRPFQIRYAKIQRQNGVWKIYNGETEWENANIFYCQFKSLLEDSIEMKGPTNKKWNNAHKITNYIIDKNEVDTGWKNDKDYGNNKILSIEEGIDPEDVKLKKNHPPITKEGVGKSFLRHLFVNKNVDTVDLTGIRNFRGIGDIMPKEDKLPTLSKMESGDTLFNQVIKNKSFLNMNGRWQIGAIYVMPIYTDDLNPFFIPFEFNPNIDEGGLTASYQSTEYLARIGISQSYMRTTLPTVTITTKYFAVSHDPTIESIDGHGWMNHFTLPKIQAIELAYRGLVMPTFPEDEGTTNDGYKYVKPPLIKVIMGNTEDKTSPYVGLLTYESKNGKLIGNKLKSLENKRTLKTFVVTEVSVKKDLIETPAYLDENLTFRDLFGYEVSLTLAEVTASYMDLYPDFRNYYNSYYEVYDPDKKAVTAKAGK